MFDLKGYLEHNCNKVDADEAFSIINDSKGIITSGGYTFFKSHYLAWGPIPSAFRGGETSSNGIFDLLKEREDRLYQMTLRDLVVTRGFYPAPFFIYALVKLQVDTEDYSVDLDDLVKFCVESPYGKESFHGGHSRTSIWVNYFANKDQEER